MVSRAARFGGRLSSWFGGMAGQIKVREMRRKRYKSPSHVPARRIVFSFADRDVLLCRCGDERDGLPPTG
jgi:hypothetical protein